MSDLVKNAAVATQQVGADAVNKLAGVDVAHAGAAMDMTLWGLFMQADIVVKCVMMLLLMASFWSWAIIFEKVRLQRAIQTKMKQFKYLFDGMNGIEACERQVENIKFSATDPLSRMFVSGMGEWMRFRPRIQNVLQQPGKLEKMIEQITRAMGNVQQKELSRMDSHVSFLATVGSASPFVGLFGTVWGIMNSFQSIALTKNTTLAVVAPGIAEALFATAIGLVAAIPAVIFYNKITSRNNVLADQMDLFTEEFVLLLNRDLER